MPYAITFDYQKKRYSTADHFKTKNEGKWLKDALSGLNPRYVPVKDMESCPAGFKKRPSSSGCVKR